MTRHTLAFVGVLVALVGAFTWVAGQSDRSPLEGVWEVQEVSGGQPDPINSPTGLLMFTGRYYSSVYLRSTDRPAMAGSEVAMATADRLRAVWGPLIANAGTFEASGNTLTVHPAVAKTGGAAAGGFREESFEIDGDTLTLTTVRNDQGPVASPRTLRLRRVQ